LFTGIALTQRLWRTGALPVNSELMTVSILAYIEYAPLHDKQDKQDNARSRKTI